jgi:hypothetical protein
MHNISSSLLSYMIRFFPARLCRISLTLLVVSFKIIGMKKARALILGGTLALAFATTTG